MLVLVRAKFSTAPQFYVLLLLSVMLPLAIVAGVLTPVVMPVLTAV